MTAEAKRWAMRTIIVTVISVLGFVSVPIIVGSLNAWGDERYVQKEADIINQIEAMDTEITVKDTEILFADDDEKAKLIAIKAIYERKKEALYAKLDD